MKSLRVYYYGIHYSQETATLASTLEHLAQLSLVDRTRDLGAQRVRLEEIRSPVAEEDYWILRFVKYRDGHWPAVTEHGVAAGDLPLQRHQHLTEETSILISLAEKRMVMQYNYMGVRASKIAEYLMQASQTAILFSFVPVLNRNALDSLENKRIFTNVTASIDGLTDADLRLHQGGPLGPTLRQAAEAQVGTVNVAFSVDARVKSNKMDHGFARGIIDWVMQRGGDNDKLVVRAKAEEDHAVEEIDLLDSRKTTSFDAGAIPKTEGKRFVPEAVYSVLEQAFREWR